MLKRLIFTAALFPFAAQAAFNCGTYVSQWAMSGNPQHMAMGPNGKLYVVRNSSFDVQIYSGAGALQTSFSGGFFNPFGIAISPAGLIYISDTNNHLIKKFDLAGSPLGSWGGSGTVTGKFNAPRAVDLDAAGNLYVADYGNNRIQEFDGNGVFIRAWGSLGSGNGQFNGPLGVAIAPNGNVYVGDYSNGRVQVFGPTGSYLNQWGAPGSGNGQFSQMYDVKADANGNIYVADISNNRIQIFDGNGAFLTAFGSAGSGNGQFNVPGGIALDNAGSLFAVDYGGGSNRIQKFNCSASVPTPTATPTPSFSSTPTYWPTPACQVSVSATGGLGAPGDIMVTMTLLGAVLGLNPTTGIYYYFGDTGTFVVDGLTVRPDQPKHLVISDQTNHRIIEMDENGAVVNSSFVTSPGSPFMNDPKITSYDPISGDLYIPNETGNGLYRVPASGGVAIPVSLNPVLNNLGGSTFDMAGNLYLSDGTGTGSVFKVTASEVAKAHLGQTAADTTLCYLGAPLGLQAVGSDLYAVDENGNIIQIDPVTGGYAYILSNYPAAMGGAHFDTSDGMTIGLDGDMWFTQVQYSGVIAATRGLIRFNRAGIFLAYYPIPAVVDGHPIVNTSVPDDLAVLGMKLPFDVLACSSPTPTPVMTATLTATMSPTPAGTLTFTPSPTPTRTPSIDASRTPGGIDDRNVKDGDDGATTYPNPGKRGADKQHFAMKLKEVGLVRITVWNSAAQLVATVEDRCDKGQANLHLTVKNFAPGIYLYQTSVFYDSGKRVTGRVQRFAIQP